MGKHKAKTKAEATSDRTAKDKAKAGKSAKAKAKAGKKVGHDAGVEATADGPPPKMTRKRFEAELEVLQGELVALQEWVKASGAKMCVLFEGRDAAGKGGVIKRITERTSPRVFKVVALPAPSEREKSQMYVQRYIPHLPAAGEVVLFDRSWYNRAGVERVMGFASEDEVERFLAGVPMVERAITDSGVLLVKYWLEVSMENQTARFEQRIDDPRKTWKLSPMDLESHRRWYDYTRARDEMFEKTDTAASPWYVVDANDQRRARLNCIAHLLSLVPYEHVPYHKPKLPPRQDPGDYAETTHPFRRVPARY